jgi:hypothetical protein
MKKYKKKKQGFPDADSPTTWLGMRSSCAVFIVSTTTTDQSGISQMTMDVLPDDVLLEIFDFHLKRTEDMDAWHTLIHVCRKWRHLVLSSSRRLNLRIFCTDKRPVREMLDI